MAWFVRPIQKKSATGRMLNIWQLGAEDNTVQSGLFLGCDHNHMSPDEAKKCPQAKSYLSGVTGLNLDEVR